MKEGSKGTLYTAFTGALRLRKYWGTRISLGNGLELLEYLKLCK